MAYRKGSFFEKSIERIFKLAGFKTSKNKKINADKVLVAIFGQDIKKEEKNLAKKFNVILWGEEDIDKYDNLVSRKTKEAVYKLLN